MVHGECKMVNAKWGIISIKLMNDGSPSRQMVAWREQLRLKIKLKEENIRITSRKHRREDIARILATACHTYHHLTTKAAPLNNISSLSIKVR